MISREDLESFLIRTEMDHQEIGEPLDRGSGPDGCRRPDHPAVVVVLSYSPLVIVFRSRIGTVPEGPITRV